MYWLSDSHDSFFFVFSPPEYLRWYPVFNFPLFWPWGIFNPVAQQHLMLHCNSASVSLCNAREGCEGRTGGSSWWCWCQYLFSVSVGPTGEFWWGWLMGCAHDEGWIDRQMDEWLMIDWWVAGCRKGEMEGRSQSRREGERESGSRRPQAKHSGANLGRAWLYQLLTWLYHLSIYVSCFLSHFSNIIDFFKTADSLSSLIFGQCFAIVHKLLYILKVRYIIHSWSL